MTTCTKCGAELDDPYAHRDHSPRCSDEGTCALHTLRTEVLRVAESMTQNRLPGARGDAGGDAVLAWACDLRKACKA
jgi:hypothetical protein